MVLQSQPLCCVVSLNVVGVVTLRGVVVTAVAPCVVSRSQPLHRMELWLWLVGLLHHAVSQLQLLRGHSGCHHAAWCRSHSCCAIWCHGCCTTCGVVVTAITLCGVVVVVGVIVLHGVAVTIIASFPLHVITIMPLPP